MKKSRDLFRWILLVFVFLAAGCSAAPSQAELTPSNGASLDYIHIDEESAGSEIPMMIRLDEERNSIEIDFSGTIENGLLNLRLENTAGEAVLSMGVGAGDFSIQNPLEDLPAGEYSVIFSWNEPVRGVYSFGWKEVKPAGELKATALIPGVGMLLVSLAFIFYAAYHHLGWKALGMGALLWVITVALKFAWALPVNTPLYNALIGALPESVALPIFYLYVGALTGAFEVGVTYLLLRFTRYGKASWNKALAFGIGFGAFEAFLLGLVSFSTMLPALINPQLYPVSTLNSLLRMNQVLFGLAPVSERLFTIAVHIFCNVLIFYAIGRREVRWFWLSFVFKSLIDALAAYAQIAGDLESLGGIWSIEALVAVWGLIAFAGIVWLRKRYPAQIEAGEEIQAGENFA